MFTRYKTPYGYALVHSSTTKFYDEGSVDKLPKSYKEVVTGTFDCLIKFDDYQIISTAVILKRSDYTRHDASMTDDVNSMTDMGFTIVKVDVRNDEKIVYLKLKEELWH